MVWLGACLKGVTPLVILDEGTVNHAPYIKEVLLVVLKYVYKILSDWIFQYDGTKPLESFELASVPGHKDIYRGERKKKS